MEAHATEHCDGTAIPSNNGTTFRQAFPGVTTPSMGDDGLETELLEYACVPRKSQTFLRRRVCGDIKLCDFTVREHSGAKVSLCPNLCPKFALQICCRAVPCRAYGCSYRRPPVFASFLTCSQTFR